MKALFKHFTKDPEGNFDEGEALNQATRMRNWIIFAALSTLAGGVYLAADIYFSPPTVPQIPHTAIDFGAVIDNDFTEKDNQSALTAQQNALDTQKKSIDSLLKTVARIERDSHTTTRNLTRSFEDFQRVMTEKIASEIDAATPSFNNKSAHVDLPFGTHQLEAPMDQSLSRKNDEQAALGLSDYLLSPRPSAAPNDPITSPYQGVSIPPFVAQNGIDSFALYWQSADSSLPQKRTPDNYVPAGSFVTAVITGGADANAGVNGQGDTVPMVFQTLNAGILPNGKPSRLNNCTIIGAVYGEISSSRGIVRTQRLSCIFGDEIIDIPVKGTVFNFGRNGIRGTTLMKNSKVIQMAGISGLLTGLGETGKALSETTSTSALGSTTTIGGSDALFNLVGGATASVGSQLADYYIKLAEQYHPIIELNPGNIVNIVFLQGFPLDPVGISEYQDALANQAQNTVPTSAQILTTMSNPLFERMPNDLAPKGVNTHTRQDRIPSITPVNSAQLQGQWPPINSPFGHANSPI